MKKITLLAVILFIALSAAGCSMDFRDMGIPFVATNTRTPKPTIFHTPTATYPPKTSFAGPEIQTGILDGDVTLLTDAELGYQAVFSPEWLVLIFDSSLEEQLVAAFGDQVPEEVRTLVSKQSQLAGIRAAAVDYTSKYAFRSQVNLTLNYVANPAAMDKEILDVLEEQIEIVPTRMPEVNVIYQNVQTNSFGVEFGKMILTETDEEAGIEIKKIVALFKISDGLLTMTGTAPEEIFTSLENVFQNTIDSIQPLQ